MRKHRLFGVVIAALLGTGLLGQRSSTPQADHVGIRLLSNTTNTAPVSDQVHTQSFTLQAANMASKDTLIALSSDVKPLPPITPPAPPPAPVAAPPPAPTAPSSGVWAELRQCESSDNYADNTGNGYYGAYQFSLSTWQSLGYSGLPSDAAPAVQDEAAQRLQARNGWNQWPQCSRRLGLT